MYTPNTFNRWIRIFYTIFLVTLVIGTPLLFSSLTRSVFEVNKLLLLRYSTLITLFLWLFHYLFLKDNNALDHNQTNSYGIGSFSWKKIGLEKIVLIWLIFNAISTIFSPNICYLLWRRTCTLKRSNFAGEAFMLTLCDRSVTGAWLFGPRWWNARPAKNWKLIGPLSTRDTPRAPPREIELRDRRAREQPRVALQ